MSLLVRTPSPAPTESLLGYVLRISEANGYETPWNVLQVADVGQGEMTSAGFPTEKLASVLGFASEALDKIAYEGKWLDGRREYRLLGHLLGRGLSSDPLCLKKPKICPHCVAEAGYIDAFWDLNIAVACPFHQCKAVSHCSSCGEPLKLYRPGLLTCKCGASLRHIETGSVTPALTELMAVLWAKVHNQPLDVTNLKAGLPVSELLSMPLRSLFKVFDLGVMDLSQGTTVKSEIPYLIAESAANVLSNWPHEFHAFLNRHKTTEESTTVGHRKYFERFYGHFFKSRTCGNDFDWMREAFVRFGLTDFGSTVVDSRLLRELDAERRFVSQNELAENLGIRPITLRKWHQKGLLEVKTVKLGNQVRYIADTASSELAPAISSDGKILGIREAADFLKIPVSVLKSINKTGHFQVRHKLKFKNGYHSADLDCFLQQLLCLSPKVENFLEAEKVVSLARVLREYRFHDQELKAGFLAAYIDGGIASVGRTGDTLSEVMFSIPEVTAYVATSRALKANGNLTQKEAAKFIDCDPQAIPGLIEKGMLGHTNAKEGIRVTRSSVERFATNYVALSALASNQKTSSRRLTKFCTEAGIALLTAERTQAGPVVFIDRTDMERLLALSLQFPVKKPIPNSGEVQSVMALRQYLDNLRATGEKLPRRGGKPQKILISKACGFNREIFYSQPLAIQLLEDFDKEEQAIAETNGFDHVSILTNYLQGLELSHTPLPRAQGGKPNKVAISKLCGFSRNVLYDNEQAKLLLEKFACNENNGRSN